MQLNLFQWDLIEISNGFRCLAELRFEQAKASFSRVLTALPSQAAAQEGLHATCFWHELFQQADALPTTEGMLLLWQNIQQHSFASNESGRDLHLALLVDLKRRMEKERQEFIEPDLSIGYLQCQLGNYVSAETQLRQQIKTTPSHGILYGFLADTLWMQDRRELANALYATALLMAPDRMCNHRLRNRKLAELVERHGVEMAPIHGFFRGVVPLVEPESPPDTHAVRIHSLLRQAEQARYHKDIITSESVREHLKQFAPEVLDQYERWLAGQEQPDPTAN